MNFYECIIMLQWLFQQQHDMFDLSFEAIKGLGIFLICSVMYACFCYTKSFPFVIIQGLKLLLIISFC
jgi:hypothetical protein